MKFGVRPKEIDNWSLKEVSDILEIMRADSLIDQIESHKK
jgi:hypothetical protein